MCMFACKMKTKNAQTIKKVVTKFYGRKNHDKENVKVKNLTGPNYFKLMLVFVTSDEQQC